MMQMLMEVLDSNKDGYVTKEELAQWARGYDEKYKDWDGDTTAPLVILKQALVSNLPLKN